MNSRGSTGTRRVAKKLVRSAGYDIVQFPPAHSHTENVAAILSKLDINLVIDVGAHFGETGIFLRSLGYREAIVSFEPVAASFSVLSDRIRHDRGWTAHQLALGGEAATGALNVPSETHLASFFPVTEFGAATYSEGAATATQETVEIQRLDSIFGDLVASIEDPRVFLKIDAQGFDLEVLEGAAGCMSWIHGVQIELAMKQTYEGTPEYGEVIDFMNGAGFEVSGFFPVSRDDHLRLLDFDCILIRTNQSPECL